MRTKPKNVKLIYDPLWGLIDVTQFIPMIDTPEFQALGFKYQLGVTSLLFPSATHTRKQHSLGALKRTQMLSDNWIKRGFINQKEADLMAAYALWHDIGHGPFSHVVEEVTRELWGHNHDENGTKIINKLKKAVESSEIDFEELKKFFTRENPLYLAVHDKNLGTEKLDYLSRDAYYTIGETPGVEYVSEHTYFIDGKIMIDEKAIDNAKSLQDFYVKMYKTVYLRKNSAIAQRMMQSMLLKLIKAEQIEEGKFWSMTDFNVLARLENTKNKELHHMAQKFSNRQLPKSAIALKITQFADIGKRKDKAQIIFGISESQMKALSVSPELGSPSKLQNQENEIARIAALPENSVFIVPPNSQERFVPKDIDIYVDTGKTAKLSDYFANHYRSLEEEGKSYSTVRICTFEEHREKLSKKPIAKEIRDYLLSLV